MPVEERVKSNIPLSAIPRIILCYAFGARDWILFSRDGEPPYGEGASPDRHYLKGTN